MAVPIYPIEFKQGEDYSLPTFLSTVTLNDDGSETKVANNLTGYTAKVRIRRAVGSAVVLELTTENGGIVLDAVNGGLKLVITHAQTLALPVGSYVYGFRMYSAGSIANDLMEGTVTVKASTV